jgi:energy-coupling factor transporter ATP-binding protein EcfA2
MESKAKFEPNNLWQLSSLFQGIKAQFPHLTLQHPQTNILVLSKSIETRPLFMRHIDHYYRSVISSAQIEFYGKYDPFPDLHDLQKPVHGIWILFSPSRYEVKSKEFIDWADYHRQLLAKTPFFALRVFICELLGKWGKPITREEVDVGGRNLMVASIAVTNGHHMEQNYPHLWNDQINFITALMMRVVKHHHMVRPWSSLAESYDLAVSREIERQAAPLLEGRIKGMSGLDTAILNARRLWQVRGLSEQASRDISQAMTLARSLDVDLTDDMLMRLSGWVAEALNQEKNRQSLHGKEKKKVWKTIDFAADFQRFYESAQLLLDKLIRDSRHRGMEREVDVLEGAKAQLSEQITVILLGPFSSGKSTFLNTLLGITGSDSALPADGKPVTATITLLEYADVEQASITFRKSLDVLPMFSRNSKSEGRFLPNRVEMKALLDWIENQWVDPLDLEVARFIPIADERKKGKRVSSNREKKINEKRESGFTESDVRTLQDIIRSIESGYEVVDLQNKNAIYEISNIHFKKYPATPAPHELAAILEFAHQPTNAMMIEVVQIKRKIESMKGVRFADTPGTGSALAYHHTLAKNYIEKTPTAPVICFFDGGQAGGEENESLVNFLKSVERDLKGSATLERVFIVITKRGKGKEAANIVGQVRRLLEEADIKGKRLHFIDSVEAQSNPDDPDWKMLNEDLKSFVDKNRSKLLIENAKLLIEGELNKRLSHYEESLSELQDDEKSRLKQLEQLNHDIEEIARIIKNFETEAISAETRIFEGSYTSFQEEVDRIDNQLLRFNCSAVIKTTRDKKIEEIKEIIKPLKLWSSELQKNLEKNNRQLQNFLKSNLIERLHDQTPQINEWVLPVDFTPLATSEIKAKANESVERKWWQTFRKGFEQKVSAIRTLLKSTAADTESKMKKQLKKAVKFYTSQALVIQERMLEKKRLLADEQNIERSIRETEDKIRFIRDCLKEFAAIERNLN